MISLNQCNFIGNLGADIELRYMPDGTATTTFSIGVADDYKDKSTGAKVEQTEWVRISAYGKKAEICAEYLKKGSKIFVTGKQHTRNWEENGVTRYTTEIRLDRMQMLDKKPE